MIFMIGAGRVGSAVAFLIGQSGLDGLVIGEHGSTMVTFLKRKITRSENKHLRKKTDEITYELRNYRKYLVASKEASVFGSAKNTFDDISKLSIFMK